MGERHTRLALGLVIDASLDGLQILAAYVDEDGDRNTLPVSERLPWGRYRLELAAEGGEIRFHAWDETPGEGVAP